MSTMTLKSDDMIKLAPCYCWWTLVLFKSVLI